MRKISVLIRTFKCTAVREFSVQEGMITQRSSSWFSKFSQSFSSMITVISVAFYSFKGSMTSGQVQQLGDVGGGGYGRSMSSTLPHSTMDLF